MLLLLSLLLNEDIVRIKQQVLGEFCVREVGKQFQCISAIIIQDIFSDIKPEGTFIESKIRLDAVSRALPTGE